MEGGGGWLATFSPQIMPQNSGCEKTRPLKVEDKMGDEFNHIYELLATRSPQKKH